MRNIKRLVLTGVLGVVLCIGIATTLAYFTDSKTIENTITMGNVAIELTEPEFAKNEDNHIQGVLPMQTVVKDPTITVDANSVDAYVRLNISYEKLTSEQEAELTNGIQLNEGWKIEGNYIYYNKVVKANDVVTAFDKVVIPNWDNDIAEAEFKMNIVAEAVQADYFTPTVQDEFIVEWPGVTLK